MNNKQYSIGEFAAINKFSTRMLRHYDKIGLLKPATVAENGYRMYFSSQIATVALIKKYRACAFSLNEIALLIGDDSNIMRLAQAKIQELKQQETTQQEALCQLYELSNTQGFLAFENSYEISLTHKNKQLLLCGKHYCTEEQIESEFDKLYDLLSAKSLHPVGLSMLQIDISADQGFRVAVPMSERFDTPDYDFKVLDAGQYLSTLHYGDYYEIGCAYDRLVLYTEQHGFKISSLFIERYFLDSTHTINPNEYITEISLKITP